MGQLLISARYVLQREKSAICKEWKDTMEHNNIAV